MKYLSRKIRRRFPLPIQDLHGVKFSSSYENKFPAHDFPLRCLWMQRVWQLDHSLQEVLAGNNKIVSLNYLLLKKKNLMSTLSIDEAAVLKYYSLLNYTVESRNLLLWIIRLKQKNYFFKVSESILLLPYLPLQCSTISLESFDKLWRKLLAQTTLEIWPSSWRWQRLIMGLPNWSWRFTFYTLLGWSWVQSLCTALNLFPFFYNRKFFHFLNLFHAFFIFHTCITNPLSFSPGQNNCKCQ